MTIAAFDHLPAEDKKQMLFKCCSSDQWVKYMMDLLPYEDLVDVLEDAEQAWYNCEEHDWLQAFSHHPKIGDLSSLKLKFPGTASLAGEEQSGVSNAANETIELLASLNKEYENKFGFIFIICATGKSASEMVASIKQRITNDVATELQNAAEEQNNITKLRLEKLFT